MIYTEVPANLDEVDVIVAGGGTAGCIIASRLAEADPALTVLVIERGSDNVGVPSVEHPALYKYNFEPDVAAVQLYFGREEEQLANRTIMNGAGGILGGGSSVNANIYGRPQRTDLDNWGVEGWSSDDLVPFLRKLETYYPGGDQSVHGSEGRIGVSSSTYENNKVARDDFLQAIQAVGYSVVPDVQDLDHGNAASPAYQYVSPSTGKRQDTASTYLRPLINRGAENLHVIVKSRVTRVLFDGDTRASGVELIHNNSTRTIKARKLVILSSGALGTPQILQRSGVGSAQVLGSAGVPIRAENSGVGEGLQDHPLINGIYNTTLGVNDTLDFVASGALNVTELLETNDPILSWNGITAYSKLRPTQAEIDSFEPSLRTAWERDYADDATRPLGVIILITGVNAGADLYPDGSYVSLASYIAYPYSRGSVHITGAEVDTPVDLRTGYFSDAEGVDAQIITWLYKKQREIARKMRTPIAAVNPAPQSANDSAADGESIKQWARESVATAYHTMGTCKMAPLEELGVVDASLSVYGTKALKVADMSIVPLSVSGNTMNTALLVGEKAADVFIRELGLSRPAHK